MTSCMALAPANGPSGQEATVAVAIVETIMMSDICTPKKGGYIGTLLAR